MRYYIDAGDLGEIEIDVAYSYTPGRRATYDDPPEPADLKLLSIKCDDLRDLIAEYLMDSDDFLQAVHDVEVTEQEAAKADYYYEQKREESLWTTI